MINTNIERKQQEMFATVSFWKNDKGYGFAKSDDDGKDYFVHISAVQRAGLDGLEVGQHLSFDVEADPKQPGRLRATNVVVLS